ncbi:MAG: hypothetical protein K9N51_09780 [Candidatus Pacebacteria bacterium]|nr:hypothetical protein [Candidatus Paceibacterota bacterium]
MVNDVMKSRIFTVFTSPGHGSPGAAPESLLTNDQLLDKLSADCGKLEFIVRDLSAPGQSAEAVVEELQDIAEDFSGVLVVGPVRNYALALNGLPTIVVYNLFEFMNAPYNLFRLGEEKNSVLTGGFDLPRPRVLTAQLDRRNVAAPDVTKTMYTDLVEKIGTVAAIGRLKQSRILSVTPFANLAQVDYQGDTRKQFPEDYNERFRSALLDALGLEIVSASPQQFFEAYREIDATQAEDLARKWADGAHVVTAAFPEIVKTGRAYLALDALREAHDCNAVSTHMRSVAPGNDLKDRFWPGLGLECGFKMRGIQAVCQDYPHILATQMLGYFMTGRPSMLGDLMTDTFNNVDILTHCGAPINPYGDERRLPYSIHTHAESPVRDTQASGSSTGLKVEWPVHEPVTVWKLYPQARKIGLHTGTIVDGHKLYRELDAMMCRTKLVVHTNAASVQEFYSPEEYGIHRAATLGDLRERVRDLAALLDFEFMEEDRVNQL